MSLSYNPLKVFLPIGLVLLAIGARQAGLRLDRQGLPAGGQHAADPVRRVPDDHRRPARRSRRPREQDRRRRCHRHDHDGRRRHPPATRTTSTASTNPIEQRMMRGFFDALDRMLDGLAPTRVLEVGIGEGEVLGRVARALPGRAGRRASTCPTTTLAEQLARRRTRRRCSATPPACRSPTARSTSCSRSRCSSTCPDPRRRSPSSPGSAPARSSRRCPFEPIWRVGNMARRRYVARLGQHPRPRQPLDPLGLPPLRRRPLRRRAGRQPAAVDDGPRRAR